MDTSYGKVFIASMNMRGTWATYPRNCKVINVTSMQKKDSLFRRDFSPMTIIEGGYKGFCCFENYWQSGKVFENIDHEISLQWWKNQTSGKRRYPPGKNKKILYSLFNDCVKRNYIQSRKQIYVPEYYELMINTESIFNVKTILESGKGIVIFDFDGPRTAEGNPDCKLFTQELYNEKINDITFPFGHGYIVAAALYGIQI